MDLAVSNQEVWRFGAQERAQRGTPLVLHGRASNGVAEARFTTLRRSGLQVGYTVTTARTLILTRVLLAGTIAAVLAGFGYADNDVGYSVLTTPTTPVLFDTEDIANGGILRAPTANTIVDVSVYFEVPAGKLPWVRNVVGSSGLFVQVFGVEVA